MEQFDQSTLSETARIVSMEGVTLVERHTAALFGSIESLSKQMQEAMGPEPIESPQVGALNCFFVSRLSQNALPTF